MITWGNLPVPCSAAQGTGAGTPLSILGMRVVVTRWGIQWGFCSHDLWQLASALVCAVASELPSAFTQYASGDAWS